METGRIKTSDEGVYYRWVNASKTSNKKIKCYYITYKNLDNKMREIKVGKATEGIDQKYAKQKRAEVLTKLFYNEDHHNVILKRKKKNAITLKEIFDEYYLHLLQRENNVETKSHREIKSKYYKHIHPTLGEKDMKLLLKSDIEALKTLKMAETHKDKDGVIKKKYSPKTINMIIEALRTILNYGVKIEKIKVNPAKSIDLLKIDNNRERYLRKEEVKELKAHLDKEYTFFHRDVFLYALVLLDTGTRVSSCLNIKIGDIDFGSKKVLLQDFKNTSTYFGKLSDKTLELIKSMYDINDTEKPLFESHKNTYARHLQKALNLLFNKNPNADRKQKVVQHSLRHTFATTVLNNGAELNTVRHLLNHRSIETSLRYSKMADSTMNKAVENLYD